MLNIHFGREDLNKDKFIFDNIKGRTLLLVPDQFTLQAERNAFFYMGRQGFMDLEVLSISRLGTRLLRQTGGAVLPVLNKYGRHMLLTKILEKENSSLKLYKNQAGRNSFIEMVNDMISEMKQYGALPGDIDRIKEDIPEDSYLRAKLEDIHRIYTAYEKEIEGKYTDTEDLNDLYADRIGQAELLRGNTVWVYGFDSFTPKNVRIISELTAVCQDVHIVLTCNDPESKGTDRDGELFDLTRHVIKIFREEAAGMGIDCAVIPVPEEYRIAPEEKTPALIALEKELYSYPSGDIPDTGSIELIQAANIHAEAETAAAKVLQLVRDEGLQYKDIMLICNDLDSMGEVAKRTFAQYGMDLFVDKKRSLIYSPAVTAIAALMDIVRYHLRTSDIFRFLKTGLSDLSGEQVEKLEMYAIRYKIKGSMWEKPFARGAGDFAEEEFAELENSRKIVADTIRAFSDRYSKDRNGGARIKALYSFLAEDAKLPEKLEMLVSQQAEAGFSDFAAETAQAWNYIVGVLDQMVQIIGEEDISEDAFAQILKAGFSAIEIGLLPPTADGLVMGSMQRTRAGRPGYTLVLGAGDGVLPSSSRSESLLSGDEKRKLFDDNIQICKMDEVRIQEEKLAIYRNLTRASGGLWMSYSVSDESGKEARASVIFDRIKRMTGIVPEKDIISREDPLLLVQSAGSTLRHLTGAAKTGAFEEMPAAGARGALDEVPDEDTRGTLDEVPDEDTRGTLDDRADDGAPGRQEEQLAKNRGFWQGSQVWQSVFDWYRKNQPERLTTAMSGLIFSNRIEALKDQTVKELFQSAERNELVLSPSALEDYSKCPFSFFVKRGLRPEQTEPFEITPLDIGNVYHEALMIFSRAMTEKGVAVTDEDSRWMTISREQSDQEIDRIIDHLIADDPDGVFSTGSEAEYRLARLRKNCREIVWTLIEDVRSQDIDRMAYEEPFGKNKPLEPLKVRAENGDILIEGRIDRADVLADDRIKVIDYKTSNKTFSKSYAEAGWDLQLMLYLKAAENESAGMSGNRKPAGVYYFRIQEPFADMNGKDMQTIRDTIADEVINTFSFDGVTVTSDISGKTTKKMTPEDFAAFSGKVQTTVEELCHRMAHGDISIKPKKSRNKSNGPDACEYCKYNSICVFERGLGGSDCQLI